jgi:hypothetical protein
MTDLQRHLKSIRKVFSHAVDHSLTDVQLVHSQLRAVLPAAYGITSGCVIANGQTSHPIQTILYDVPLSNGAYTKDTSQFQIEHVLMVADLAVDPSSVTFQNTLERLASVKRLPNPRKREPNIRSLFGQE